LQNVVSNPFFTKKLTKMKIAVAKGDGIGPEIMEAVLGVFNAAKVPLEYQYVDMGKWVFDKGFSIGMTPEAKEAIEQLGILFKGPMETPKGKGVKSVNVTARKTWNTYANDRKFQTLSGVDTVFSKAGINIDLTIVRENIEDTYGGIEHMLTQDVAIARRFITRGGSEQVIRYAFEMAQKKGARRITCGHKANIMKLTDGLFLEVFNEIAKEYPNLKADDVIVDDLCMLLLSGLNMLRHLGMMEKAVMIENALLYTLESGVHTGDFGDKSIPSVNTTVFAQTIIDNFGKQPTQNPKPSLKDFDFVPTNSAITKNPMLLSSKNEVHKIVGADFFVETTLQPNELAAVAIKQEKDQLKLVTISNRGTQVWPTGSVFTNLVNQYRIRFETDASNPLTQSDILNLYAALSKDLQISSVEILSMWGDKKAYSLAQGQ